MLFRSFLRWTAPLLLTALSLQASAQATPRMGFQHLIPKPIRVADAVPGTARLAEAAR